MKFSTNTNSTCKTNRLPGMVYKDNTLDKTIALFYPNNGGRS